MAVASAWAAVVLLSIVGASGSEAMSCAYERCGSHNGKMCSSSSYPCCSSYGYCGNTAEHCGKAVAYDNDPARCSQATTEVNPGNGMSLTAWLAVAGSIVLTCALLAAVSCCWRLYKSRRGDDDADISDRSHDPAWAAVTLDQLNDFRNLAKAELGLDYVGATMHDVNSRILQPFCDQHRKCYAQVVNVSGLKHIDIFVSHAWAENFDEFVTAVNAPFAHWLVKPNLWICALALVQSTDPDLVAIQVGVGDDPSHAPFTRALAQADKILVVRNQQVDIYGRIWCCWEMFTAYQLNFMQKPGGIMVVGSPGDADTQQIDIATAEASNLEDKLRILHHITSHAQTYDSVNRIVSEVRQFVADAVA